MKQNRGIHTTLTPLRCLFALAAGVVFTWLYNEKLTEWSNAAYTLGERNGTVIAYKEGYKNGIMDLNGCSLAYLDTTWMQDCKKLSEDASSYRFDNLPKPLPRPLWSIIGRMSYAYRTAFQTAAMINHELGYKNAILTTLGCSPRYEKNESDHCVSVHAKIQENYWPRYSQKASQITPLL